MVVLNHLVASLNDIVRPGFEPEAFMLQAKSENHSSMKTIAIDSSKCTERSYHMITNLFFDKMGY